jgi:hypothetical protein
MKRARSTQIGRGKFGNSDQRRALRLMVDLDVLLSGTQVGRQTIEICDISVLGCRIACPSNYQEGTRVIVTIPGLSPIGAEVRWSDHAYCGIRFSKPLHPLVAERIAALARSNA